LFGNTRIRQAAALPGSDGNSSSGADVRCSFPAQKGQARVARAFLSRPYWSGRPARSGAMITHCPLIGS
jgi:hypothetical protein